MVAKNFSRFSSLFGQETGLSDRLAQVCALTKGPGTTNDALLGYSSACKSMQKLHADLQVCSNSIFHHSVCDDPAGRMCWPQSR